MFATFGVAKKTARLATPYNVRLGNRCKRKQRQGRSEREHCPAANFDESPVRFSIAEAFREIGMMARGERANRLWPKHT
jgi:hypothetical protein